MPSLLGLRASRFNVRGPNRVDNDDDDDILARYKRTLLRGRTGRVVHAIDRSGGFDQLIFHGRASLGSRVAWLSGLDHSFLCSFFLSLLFLLIAGRISALRLACIRGLFGKTCHLFGVPCAVLSRLNVTICLMRITSPSSCYWQRNVRMPSISVQLAW